MDRDGPGSGAEECGPRIASAATGVVLAFLLFGICAVWQDAITPALLAIVGFVALVLLVALVAEGFCYILIGAERCFWRSCCSSASGRHGSGGGTPVPLLERRRERPRRGTLADAL